MNPNDLITELQSMDFDYFLSLMLDQVPEDIDKREGSIIYDALAPSAYITAMVVLDLANIIKQTYIRTAEGEFLDYRAVEHGTERYGATYTEVKAKFLDIDGNAIHNVNIGDRFASIGEQPVFYTVTKINDDFTGLMVAEESGTRPNSYLGQILPVTPNDDLVWAEIIEISAPSRDAETDDHLRERLLSANSWINYGGNVADYLDMLSKIPEVGAGQVYPTWQGAGTVKLVILDNDLNPASPTLVKQVKEAIDPEDKETLGYGLAPIDHRVTVVAPESLRIDVKTQIKLASGANRESVENAVNERLGAYFKQLRSQWNKIDVNVGRGYSMTVYRSKILSIIMMVEGVANADFPLLNGAENDIALKFTNEVSQIPMLGTVALDG